MFCEAISDSASITVKLNMFRINNIHVKYSYKTVLKGISLNFQPGQIYSLLGENGAGKSTLARVICGDLQPTSGQLFLDDKEIHLSSPKAAIAHGIVCVHQRPLLAPTISILDNLRIGTSRAQLQRIPELTEKWLPGKKLSEPVKNLNEKELFYTSLTGALLKNPRILILDEPPALDTKKIRNLAESGLTIIIITHSFKEALEKSDEVVLLKDGQILEIQPAALLTEAGIKEKLFGLTREIKLPSEISKQEITEEEVLQKRTVLPRVGYIPSDRVFRASNPDLTVLQLLTAYHTNLKKTELEKFAEKLLLDANVNIRLREKASCLSGGMLQRLILERELAEKPDTLYLFNPTQGLDAEATERLYQRLCNLAQNGIKVIIGESK